MHDLRAEVAGRIEELAADPPTRALTAFAEKVTVAPATVTPADLDLLRFHGFSDRAIHDAAQAIAYFNYINRIANTLGVDLEDWMIE